MDDDEFVKQARNFLGLSQNQFAELLGKKSARTIRKWEEGGEVQRTDLIAIAYLISIGDMDLDHGIESLFEFSESILEKNPAEAG